MRLPDPLLWSVGAAAARCLGKAGARVRLPDGPLRTFGPACRWGRLTLARSVCWVQLPSGPLNEWAHGPTGRRQLGRLEIRVQFPVGPLIWKVAGYGWPGRFAKPSGAARCRVGSNPMPSASCLDGEMDDHISVLTRDSGFESWSRYWTARSDCLR